MDVPRRTDSRRRDPRPAGAAAAGRAALAAARRAQLEQVRAAVRLRLAAIQRHRQELAARRKPPAAGGR
jgi:hypothetical protein